MTDVEKWKLRGAVRTMHSEFAEWDPATMAWKPSHRTTFVAFDPLGNITQLDQPGPNQSVSRSTYLYDADRLVEQRFGVVDGPVERLVRSYDEAGRLVRTTRIAIDGGESTREICTYDSGSRKTSVQYLQEPPTSNVAVMYGVADSEISYGAPGAKTLTTRYNDRDQAIEALFEDAEHKLIRRITRAYDSVRRLLTEEAQIVSSPDLESLPSSQTLSAEDHAKLLSLVSQVFGSIVTSFTYDAKGRKVAEDQRMGALSVERTMYEFDDHDSVIMEATTGRSREASLRDDGSMTHRNEQVRSWQTRMSYVYDGEGNWTERVVWIPIGSKQEFQRSNVEHRTFTYYTARQP